MEWAMRFSAVRGGNNLIFETSVKYCHNDQHNSGYDTAGRAEASTGVALRFSSQGRSGLPLLPALLNQRRGSRKH